MFGAFLAGYAIAGDKRRSLEALETLKKFSFAVFIPIYFAVVGYRLDLSRNFSFAMLAIFLVVACVVKLFSAGMGARFAGFGWRDSVNLAMATNARGGPGIINAAFYTTLVLVAVLTSQAAGAWLDYVLRKGWPLLEGQPADMVPVREKAEDKLVA